MPKYWGGNYFSRGSFPEVGQKQKTEKKKKKNTPGTRVGPVKYWGKQIFSLGRFPDVGQKQKTEKKKERKKVERKWVTTMASYALQMSPRVAHVKPPGPKKHLLRV